MRWSSAVCAVVLGLSGCDDAQEDRASVPLVAHEWGTFTAVAGSDGRLHYGMHHAEEALPDFVHRYDDGDAPPPSAVNEKLETPVIYFYAPRALDVVVEVGFPQGIVSEWYPRATSFDGDAGAMRDGRMRWDLSLVPRAPRLVPVPDDSQWAPSRRVDATTVIAGEEEERFLFYRGLGRFDTPLTIRHDGARIVLENDAAEIVPAAFLLHVHSGGARVESLGAIPPGERILLLEPSPKEHDPDVYLEDARAAVRHALVAAGLTPDEAIAMIDTWSNSYFASPGMRVLYVLPRAWSDSLLPLRIEPVPTELVRVLVGRVEVMAPAEERAIADRLETLAVAMPSDASTSAILERMDVDSLGRLAEPKLRRAIELVDDPAARTLGERIVAELAARP